MKKVIIMKGLPGTGKSFTIKTFMNPSVICSADQYFYTEVNPEQPDVYSYDGAKIGLAHEWCKNKFRDALENSQELVVVDNTNTTKWEYQYYYDLAKSKGYEVEFWTPKTQVWAAIERLLEDKVGNEHVLRAWAVVLSDITKYSGHNVPIVAIEKMIARWETL